VNVARAVATLGPVGLVPIAPATAASALVTLIGWFLPSPPWPMTLLLLVAGTALAIWVCGEAEKSLGHDAGPIVADEVIGQCLALLFAPRAIGAFVAAFLLFRLFDVWKPLGADGLQRLPGGLGVVADDVAAGLMACGALHLILVGMRAAGWSP
jgi:phosphatidylglycerophosphatase A